MRPKFPNIIRSIRRRWLPVLTGLTLCCFAENALLAQQGADGPPKKGNKNTPRNQKNNRESAPLSPEQFDALKREADSGNPAAQYEMAVRQLLGDGAEKDVPKALEWANKAADQDFPPAHHLLGVTLLDGLDGKAETKDEKKAAEHISQAAEFGFAPSQFIYGMLLEEGRGVTRDEMEAFKWYRRAGWQGEAHAQNAVAFCLIKGKGVAQNLKEAMKWLDAAVKQNLPEAQVQLGNCYYEGNGVERDYKKAEQYFNQAAAQESVSGLNSIAWMQATCPDSKFHNAKNSLEKALKSVELTEGKNYALVDTLAAAHARNGDFSKAMEAQKKAMDLLNADTKIDKTEQISLKKEFEDRLKLYEQGKPFVEEPREPEKPKTPPNPEKPLKGKGNSVVA